MTALAPLRAADRHVLFLDVPDSIRVKAGESVELTLRAELAPGHHVNSDKPSDKYLIPLRLTWTADPLRVAAVEFPEPKMERYAFSDKPLSVFTGDFDIVTRFEAPAAAAHGRHAVTGALRYQACTDNLCLPPKTIPVQMTVDIK